MVRGVAAVAVPVALPPPAPHVGEPVTVAVARTDWTEESVVHCPGVTTVGEVEQVPSVNTVVVTEQLDSEGAPQVQGVQARVSVADAQARASGNAAGQAWVPGLQMQVRASKGAGGGSHAPFAQVGSGLAKPQTTASIDHDRAGTVALPPPAVQELTVDEGEPTSKVSLPGSKGAHFPRTSVVVAVVPMQVDFQWVCTGPGAHVTVGVLHVQAAHVAAGAESSEVPPWRTEVGYAPGQLGEVPGGPW